MQGEFSRAGRLLQAQAELTALLDFVQEDSQTEEISQVEKQPFSKLLDLGRSLLGGMYLRKALWLCGSDLGARGWKSVGVSPACCRQGGFVRGDVFRCLVRFGSGEVTLMMWRKGEKAVLWTRRCVYLKGSPEVEAWVAKKEAQLKAGKVGYVVGGLKKI